MSPRTPPARDAGRAGQGQRRVASFSGVLKKSFWKMVPQLGSDGDAGMDGECGRGLGEECDGDRMEMGVWKICQHAGQPRPRGQWGTGPKMWPPLQCPAQPRALPAARGSHCHDTGGQGVAPSPNIDWGCPRSVCFARECRRQRLLRWAAQRGQPAAQACSCSRGLQPRPHTGAFPGLHMLCTYSGPHCSCFWGHPEQEEMLAAARTQDVPCNPSRPTCNPTCALLNHTPHAHACPRTHTLPCGVLHAVRTPSPPLGAPGWGSTGQLHCSDWTLWIAGRSSAPALCPRLSARPQSRCCPCEPKRVPCQSSNKGPEQPESVCVPLWEG